MRGGGGPDVSGSGEYNPGLPVPSGTYYPPSKSSGLSPSGTFGPLTGTPVTGGLPNPWDTGATASGILMLPIMKQSDGGSEAAIRGCGPTSSRAMDVGCAPCGRYGSEGWIGVRPPIS